MTISVRRLGPGDEATLNRLAAEDADFDLEGRGEALPPPDLDVARRYLANPAVLHWVAFEEDAPVGSLYCVVLPLDTGSGSELLLYDIGVHRLWRKRGIGRLLLDAMEAWMYEHHVTEVWVLADNSVAVAFYRACGFAADEDQPVYMARHL